MPRKKKKRYSEFRPTIDEAIALQRRIAAGHATPAETLQYQRIINQFRRKFESGQLSPQSAQQFGID